MRRWQGKTVGSGIVQPGTMTAVSAAANAARAIACAVAVAWACAGCGGRHGQEGDADAEGDGDGGVDFVGDGEDAPADAIREAEIEWPDAAGVEAEEATSPTIGAQCGDGHIDLEASEECDDRNRLNGDGCDWQCRMGDGEPGPGLDPDVGEYEPDGEAVVLAGDGTASWDEGGGGMRVPIVWTGSEYATSWVRVSETLGIPWHMRFLRFDELGVPIDAGWAYSVPDMSLSRDLIWLGDGFALFFDLQGTGILLLFLDPDGKPRGDPIVVVADPGAQAPAADIADGGFVLAWLSSAGSWLSGCDGSAGSCSTMIRRIAPDGTTAGMPGPIIVDDRAEYMPDVATGEAGFGITMGFALSPRGFRFVQASEDLSTFVYSGILGDGFPGDVVAVAGGWSTAWVNYGSSLGGDHRICAAHFAGSGDLAHPPVCTETWGTTVSGAPSQVRIAADGVGLGIVWYPASDVPGTFPLLIRTDFLGNQVLDPIHGPTGLLTFSGSFAVAHADDAFGVVVAAGEDAWFQRFVAR